jgi:hypothetical protein
MRDYILFFRSPQTKWQENAGKEGPRNFYSVKVAIRFGVVPLGSC